MGRDNASASVRRWWWCSSACDTQSQSEEPNPAIGRYAHGIAPNRFAPIAGGRTRKAERLLYCDHVEGNGEGLFQLACEHALEPTSQRNLTRRVFLLTTKMRRLLHLESAGNMKKPSF